MDRPHPALPNTAAGVAQRQSNRLLTGRSRFRKLSTRTTISTWTSSSGGRATLLHGEGPGFEASEVHQASMHGWRNRQTRDVEGVVSERTSRFEAGVVHHPTSSRSAVR